MSEPDAFKISEAVIDLWRCYTIERDMAKELEAENARLKAEVERLTAFTTRTIIPNEELQAQVERLEKAIMDSVEMRQRLREIENGNQSK